MIINCLNKNIFFVDQMYSFMDVNTELLKELLDKSANGVVMVNVDGIIQYANNFAHLMFKYQSPQLIGQSIEILIPPQYQQHHGQHIRQFFTENKSRNMGEGNHFPAIKANGEQFYISVHITPSDDKQHMIVTVTETTKHKKTEGTLKAESAELQKVNQQLLQFTRETTNALLITDEEFRIIWINPAFQSLTGYSLSDVQLEKPFVLVGEDTSLLEMRKLQNAIDSQTQYDGELLFYRKNTSSFWSVTNTQPYLVDNQLQGFLMLFADITEQKELERRLIENNNLQKAILNSAPILLFSTGQDGLISTFNEYATHLLECNTVDVVDSRTPLVFLTDRARAHLCDALSIKFTQHDALLISKLTDYCSQQTLQIELELASFNRKKYTVEIIISAVETLGRNTLGLLWLGRDVTSQRSTEAEIYRIRKLLETTGQMAQLGGWELDLRTNELYWSDEVYRIHELPIGSEVKVEEAINYYAPEARPIISHAIEQAIKNDQAWDEQLPFITAKGNQIWVRAVGYAEYENSQPVRLRGAFQNITQLKDAEQAALAASAAKSDFLANMSHEIRTPLNGIIGINQLMINTSLTSQQRDYVAMIGNSSDSLLRIVNDILDFAKIKAGKLDLKPVNCDVNSLLEKLVSSFKAQSEHNAKLDFSIAYDSQLTTPVLIDEGRLQQVLSNLISNAVKFTPRGSISILVSLESNNNLLFKVTDTGIGIHKSKLASLFDKFSQVDSSVTREHGGTGLGLAICKQIVELMGGEIGVQSTLNSGSCFWFRLPYTASDYNLTVATYPQPIRALIVCSNESQIERWHEAMLNNEFSEIKLTFAASAPLALRTIQKLPTDAVVIYSDLTGMAGVEFAKHLRAQDDLTHLKLIGINDSNSENLEALYRDIGVAGYYQSTTTPSVILDDMRSNGLESLSFSTSSNSPNNTRGKISVLLVEDNEINQIVARDMLESLGCDVTVLENGKLAVDIVKQKPREFDIIFMDCQMPVLDGYSATTQIRQLDIGEYASQVPIVALTANAMPSDKQRCLDAGMDFHIGKPFKIESLQEMLEKLV